ncbi:MULTISPECIES: flagellar basal-body MS-ring/collar protein FliF [Rubrivivax]|uniref:Flagellar M-ring protein n=1 Tax=Rubrivivax benzoatilyticus TaxID=316997 RepID=A0ABX0HY50_9BURK|nr:MULTISPECIES: flagellar basal-body MS-ring/collar protein FliF [Rubrivivax]MCD0418428.1 flagellar M-ring protein FliF [Rubrivivax sp. JA1024]EGJ11373.1 flagellar M-ring protein FliF [Rubrivivax benzoatilyticus JA2 = ATCC BAA-35]MCC9596178.1 flagellar M-ring protein FliF [Rubrivivax sp. JA1055]MCC9647481.1 flagellar M-ring protein FliF [Rubrivivax sp. JA1029]NHK99921.1 flagellar basal body M-ring protein FliF [Rubrivivax benzoatilyticus]
METAVVAQPPLVPETPPGFVARLTALPMKTKVMAGAGLAALLAIVVVLALSLKQDDYRVLFANVGEKDGGAIVEKLAQMNVPYRFSEGGGTIMVPASQVYDLRLKLSAAGLPKGSITGYELLDKTAFGQTQGQERINLQRALEGELTRTIQTLSSVETARVHLALPNQNGFFREQQKPSASVVLTLRPGHTLDRAQLAGIVHLVSSSVPELSAKAVSVLDGDGSLLSSQDNASQGLDTQQLQYVREVEATYLRRVNDLLEPVLGRDNLRATVTAEVDFSQTEQTSEEFKPNQGDNPAAVRASRVSESTRPGANVPSGVPGAVSNQPPVPASAPINGPAQALQAANGGAAGGNAQRDAETRYEVDKTVRVIRGATGTVRRINAAVVVNHRNGVDAKGKPTSTPLSQEELDKLTALVEQGIGFSKERGDSVRVVNAPFRVEKAPEAEEVPIWQQPWVLDLLRSGATPAALVLVALIVVFTLIRPAIKAAAAKPEPIKGETVDELVDGGAALPGPDQLPALEAPRSNDKLEAARKLARENPAAVANIVRGWVSGEAA